MTLPLVGAVFEARPNRFIVEARLEDNSLVEAHLADPGRLHELLIPGASLRLRPVDPERPRRTRYTVALVRASSAPAAWVCLETTFANHLAGDLLRQGRVEGVEQGCTIDREVRHGKSRFDFRLRRDEEEMFVEVKSVTLVEDRNALFPDAPTKRGARHVRELTEMARDGGSALLLFIIQREDARRVSPHAGIDPEFTSALVDAAQAGVQLRAARYRLDEDGTATWMGDLPVVLPVGPGENPGE